METPFVPVPLLAELEFGSEFGLYKHVAPRRRFCFFVTAFQRQGVSTRLPSPEFQRERFRKTSPPFVPANGCSRATRRMVGHSLGALRSRL
jgi:hypothetical protein